MSILVELARLPNNDNERPSTMQCDLLLKFENSKPIDATQIGLLLREVSGAYHEYTGRTLVLRRYELGSTLMYFADAVAVGAVVAGNISDMSTAAQTTLEFVKYLSGFFTPEKSVTGSSKAIKAAHRIAKIAAEHKADVELSYEHDGDTGSEKFSYRLTSSQSEKQLEALKESKSKQMMKQGNTEIREHLPEYMQFVQKIETGGDLDINLLEIVIPLLLDGGAEDLLSSLAEKLEAAGKYEHAGMVRERLRGHGNDFQKLPI